ncbi:hypothetical protein M2401_005865 [Pseudomonas sp. JUb42]|jgi:hypothetical protein|nr:hypothetical protein [Pseudomonas sp. JUb42]MCS3472101.1 hypothetical protein [Pseudomonas sp. JUb42]
MGISWVKKRGIHDAATAEHDLLKARGKTVDPGISGGKFGVDHFAERLT